MPPRIRGTGLPLPHTDMSLQRLPNPSCLARSFATTPSREERKRVVGKIVEARDRMFRWLEQGPGRKFMDAPRSPRYLGQHEDQPFPLNPLFRSQPVLSEDMKELIWDKVMGRGDAIKAVSAEMGVDVRRVAAVVRMKEVEKQWIAQKKKLATPYAKAVMRMLPKTFFEEGGKENVPHEPINEVLVHKYTLTQLFEPVSESRHFTREDAAAAFHERMLSADTRSPQPELIEMERAVRRGEKREEAMAKLRVVTAQHEEDLAEKIRKGQEREERSMRRVQTGRCEFRFKDMKVEGAGSNGRAWKAVGWRYGAPYNDRKRGQVKIPTSVP